MEDLVQRAFLRATGARLSMPPPPPPPLVIPHNLPIPEPAPVADTQAPGEKPEVDDPFSETTGAMDLRWDGGDTREPFSETPATGAPSGSEPGEEARPSAEAHAVPISFGSEPSPVNLPDVPILFALPVDEGAAVAEPGPEAPAGFSLEPAAGEGPGNETLNRLSREAESIDLNSVFPRGPSPGVVPFALASEDGEERGSESGGPEPEPLPFADDEDTVLTIPRGGRSDRGGEGAGPRVGIILGTVAVLGALAGLGYLLVGLWVERSATPPPVGVARPRPAATPMAAPSPAPAEATAVPLATVVAERKGSAPPGTGLVASNPSPVPTVAPTVVPTPLARAVPARQSRDGLIVTKDRAGQVQIFSIHFTSYKDRASAERDLKRIQGLAGREGYVAEVDLGEKGVWQRVMVGAFATAQEAKAVREELAAKGTRDLGWVYRVVGPEEPERR